MNIFNRICMLAAMACASSMVVAKDIVVSSTAPYHDPVVIAENIKSECTDLGNNFVKSTKKYLQASGWQVTLGEGEVASVAGRAVELKIANAVSIGNWFSSHRKNVMITATLYENGEVVDSYTKTRNSNGGIAGSFKSSCAVLYRCVNTLGNDVAKWLNGKQ